MRAVSKTVFYATVGKLDVHPTIISAWLPGYIQSWRLRDGREVGVTKPSMDGEITHYFTKL